MWTGLVMAAKCTTVIMYITGFKGRYFLRSVSGKKHVHGSAVQTVQYWLSTQPLSASYPPIYEWPCLEKFLREIRKYRAGLLVRSWMSFPCSVRDLRPLRCYAIYCSTRLGARSSSHSLSKRDFGELRSLPVLLWFLLCLSYRPH